MLIRRGRLRAGYSAVSMSCQKNWPVSAVSVVTEEPSRPTSVCYRSHRKRLARELEGQSNVQEVLNDRLRVMNGTNPRVVLRNYIAQNAIEAAENGDFSEVSF